MIGCEGDTWPSLYRERVYLFSRRSSSVREPLITRTFQPFDMLAALEHSRSSRLRSLAKSSTVVVHGFALSKGDRCDVGQKIARADVRFYGFLHVEETPRSKRWMRHGSATALHLAPARPRHIAARRGRPKRYLNIELPKEQRLTAGIIELARHYGRYGDRKIACAGRAGQSTTTGSSVAGTRGAEGRRHVGAGRPRPIREVLPRGLASALGKAERG
jgi:hypothetical protein